MEQQQQWVSCFPFKKRQGYKKPVWEMSREEQMNPPNGVLFDEEDLLEFAEGDISKVFGPQFKIIDSYARRVRLPAREYLLVNRVTKMNAAVNEFVAGATMSTEYDLPYNSELSEGGDVPWAILVESGQCDLMLISYLGIDFQCKSERVYRLLDTTLTFYGVAKEGQTLVYDIKINSYAKGTHGGISMFFFEYNCYVDGKLLIEMRNGAAGFFNKEELDAGKGVIQTEKERLARSKIVKAKCNPCVVAVPNKTAYSEEDMQNLIHGRWGKVMDSEAGRGDLNYKLCAKKMLMIDRVTEVDINGGVYGLGFCVGEKILERDMWFFPCHFPGDQVMAGSLVSDGCSQLLKLFMIHLGLHSKVQNPQFLPIPGNPNKVRCRGQISPHKGKLVYCMEIREIGIEKDTGFPYAIADVDIIDVDFELGQTFDRNHLDRYGRGDQTKKIVVDFKGIALRIEGKVLDRPTTSSSEAASAADFLVPFEPIPSLEHCLKNDPQAPKTVTWHPLGGKNGAPIPTFSPTVYPPRQICFLPFPNNPNDHNHAPGVLPLTWYNMCEFMCGKVSLCLGEEFKRFDVSTTSRSPAFDLAMVTRVLEVSNIEKGKFLNVDVNPSKGSMVAEFDCPADAWFFKGNSNDSLMPYSVLMEIGLQTSGILTSWVKAPLTMDRDNILFRNLDADAELLRVVDLRGKTITNRSRVKNYSMLGNMGIHTFYFELLVDGEVFYKGDTSFGWFIPEVFEKQNGLDNGKKSDPWFVSEKKESQAIVYNMKPGHSDRAKLYQASAEQEHHHLYRRSQQCEYLDSALVIPGSGKFGKGYAHGYKFVNKQDWFFSCHFWMDPVMPGSLGIESMIQAMEVFAVHEKLASKFGISNAEFSMAPGKTSWKYRGQLTPKNSEMDCEVHIKSIEKVGDNVVEVVADGFLFVDKLRVYSAVDLRLRISSSSKENKKKATVNSAASSLKLGVSSVADLKNLLLNIEQPVYLTQNDQGALVSVSGPGPNVCEIFPCLPKNLGDKTFMEAYNVDYPMYTGAMAKGIASADLVIAAGKNRILGSFGAGGLPLHIVKASLEKIQAALPNGPYAVNLIHSPFDDNLEKGNVDLFLERKVRVVEASAFMNLTAQVVRYRVAGLVKSTTKPAGVEIQNRIIAKVSRTELAEMFCRPAPEKLLEKLLSEGSITAEQSELARKVPMCDDIAVEADSGGHTDNRPIHVILPLIIATRNRIHKECGFPSALRVRVGAGGGIGCPAAASAAFNMGAAFIITGTINQLSKQSGSSDIVRSQLAAASYSDITMAPAADMFDQGVELQVLKKGTMFPARAKRLYELFVKFNSFEEFPPGEIEKLEKQVFRKPLATVWQETRDFYINILHNQEKVDRAEVDGKLKMSLCFRWYLGQSSSWANNGVKERAQDYQVWCGPAIGSFNDFIRGTYLDFKVSGEYPCVAQSNMQLMRGTCFHERLQQLKSNPHVDVDVYDSELSTYVPSGPL